MATGGHVQCILEQCVVLLQATGGHVQCILEQCVVLLQVLRAKDFYKLFLYTVCEIFTAVIVRVLYSGGRRCVFWCTSTPYYRFCQRPAFFLYPPCLFHSRVFRLLRRRRPQDFPKRPQFLSDYTASRLRKTAVFTVLVLF